MMAQVQRFTDLAPICTPTQYYVHHGDTNFDEVFTAGDAQQIFLVVLGSMQLAIQ
ncbi:hypothetical protein K8T06_15975 [bacterium]|nr:hypothetical protein [bacterium]